MKIKKVLPVLLSLFMVGGGALAGCKKPDPTVCDGTNHIMAEKLAQDGESGHHTVTACSNHDPIEGEVVAHNYDATFKCKDCDYQHQHTGLSEITYKDGTGHYKKTECEEHGVRKVEKEAHVFDNDDDLTCNKCGYTRVPAHQHTWSTTYTNADEKGHYSMATCEGHTDQQSDYMDHVYENDEDMTCDCGYTRTADTSVALAATSKIYVVGDSTVCSYAKGDDPASDNYYLPRYGYGTQLHQYLNVQESQVVNLALSGRSSKSFLTEANYTELKNSIKEGDYLIIGFGHNDEKSDDAARFASAKGDRTVAGSFQNILYENYVKLATDKGATPILCTPITRYDASGSYTGAKVHVTADGDYPGAIKALGEATDTTVIDLTKLTSDLYKEDNVAAQNFHAHTSYDGDGENKVAIGRDDTHINKYGAETVCYLFANALKDTNNSLAAQVITNKLAPAKGTHFPAAVKASYAKPAYEEFDPAETTARNLTGEWYATAFGDIGGASKVEMFTISSEGSNKFTVSNTTGNGKFAAASDGLGAAFMQVDARKNFTISATIKVTGIATSANNQSAFGLMLRDDIHINVSDSSIHTNYVAAGAIYKAKGGAENIIFSRENDALTKENNTFEITEGATYTASITRVGQAVTVKFGNGTTTFEKVYTDFDFLSVDNDYMYICLFANRGLSVEFSDVEFKITGTSQGA